MTSPTGNGPRSKWNREPVVSHNTRRTLLLVITVCGSGSLLAADPPRLPIVEPADVGVSATRLAAIDAIVAEGLARDRMPGAVVLVARRGAIVYRRAFGFRRVEPSREPMTVDTLFDLASLTKPVATATSIGKLIETGRLKPDDPVAQHLPDFAANGKGEITVAQLLTHTAGLIPDNALRDYGDGREQAFARIHDLKPTAAPGSRFVYSDVGFLVLGELVETLSERSLEEFTRQQFFEPLGLRDTGFLPSTELAARAATTEQREGRWMRGEVHDPRAYALGGVAGHAGLFSTADDLAVFAQMLHGRGTYAGVRVLDASTVDLLTTPRDVPRGRRTYGWDNRSPYSSNRGDLLSDGAFGHGGFTGTAMWIDPDLELTVIFLSNRVHPKGEGSVNDLAGRIAAAAVREE
jgi:serine-type D-Ala-D-Ala carboxypeptidase